VFVLL